MLLPDYETSQQETFKNTETAGTVQQFNHVTQLKLGFVTGFKLIPKSA